jgi:uncharacterized protein YbjT (DUF2867 family)
MHQTILVTGATGTVGREIVKQLAMVDGVRVRAGVHSLIKGENLKRLPDVELVEIEFNNPESLHAAFTHVDKLFLITPFADEQVEMAKTLLDEAKNAGVKHIVNLSFIGAGAKGSMQLARWHREIEEYIEQSGIPYTFLRPNNFMQNFEHDNAESIRQDGKLYMSTGNGKVAYIDARDIATVGVEALLGSGHEGKTYDLTGPEALAADEIAEMISEVTGQKVAFVNIPEDVLRERIQQQDMADHMVNAILELNSYCRNGRLEQVTKEVEQVAGCKPHTFKQYIQDHKDCFQAEL